MDTIAAAVIGWIEFIVLGAFALALIAYALAVYHPLKWGLYEYAASLRDFWLARSASSRKPPALVRSEASAGDEPASAQRRYRKRRAPAPLSIAEIVVALGALYYLGVVANAASYWMIEPVRFKILDIVYKDADKNECSPPLSPAAGGKPPTPSDITSAGNRGSELELRDALVLPLTHFTTWSAGASRFLGDPKQSSGVSASIDLRCETFVESHVGKGQPLEGLTDTIFTQLKFVRLLRGTALFALLAGLICLLKCFAVFATTPIWMLRHGAYERLIDERSEKMKKIARERKPDFEVRKNSPWARLKVGYLHLFVPQLAIILPASAALYILAMGGYRTTEFEFAKLLRNSGEQLQIIMYNQQAKADAPPDPVR